MNRSISTPAVVAIAALIASAGCGGSSAPKATSTPMPKRTIVNIRLQEYAVMEGRSSAPAGLVSFQPKNTGPKLKHELVVVKTSRSAASLPTKADGSVNEKSAALTMVGRIAAIPVGSTGATTFTLAAGRYVLFCNLVTKAGAHYKLGMWSAFTVT